MAILKVGKTVKAGTLLLFTSGEYSDYRVGRLFRAKVEFVIPGRANRWLPSQLEPDTDKIAADPALVEEVAYDEIWRDA